MLLSFFTVGETTSKTSEIDVYPEPQMCCSSMGLEIIK